MRTLRVLMAEDEYLAAEDRPEAGAVFRLILPVAGAEPAAVGAVA